MDVTLNREPKLSKIDHLFVLLAENDRQAPVQSIQKVIDRSGFSGRSDEVITFLSDEPRKVTLVGLGKRDAMTLRGIRAALFAIGKTAKKQRDRSIAVALPYSIPNLEPADSTRV